MKPFKSYETAKPYVDQERLPAGGYVVKVLDAKEVERDWGKVLEISFDIAEGEHTGFYRNNYALQQQEDKRWKGKANIRVPKDDGSEKDEWTSRSFKTMMVAFEESNAGYHWDWDETKLKDKIVGAVFQNKEYDFNGRTGFFTAFHSFKLAELIRSGNFKLPKDKLLMKDGSIPEGFIEDEDLPF